MFTAVILFQEINSQLRGGLSIPNNPALETQSCNKHIQYTHGFIIFKAPNKQLLLHMHESCDWPCVNVVSPWSRVWPALRPATLKTTYLIKGTKQFGYVRLV